MRSGNRTTPLLVRVVAALLAVSGSAGAGTLSRVQLPRPVTSAEFEKIVKEAEIPQAERAAVDAAFDAYVDEWQRLRDRTLRPLGDDVDQLESNARADMTARGRQRGDVEQTPERQQAEAAEFERAFAEVEAARAALVVRARQAYERVGQLEARLVAALRAGPRSDRQTRVIDALAQERAQRLVAAKLRSTDPRRTGRMLSRLPAAPKDLDPAVAAAFHERLTRLDGDALRLSQRVAEVSLADGDNTQAITEAAGKLIDLRLKTIDELGASLPADVRMPWVESARRRMLRELSLAVRVPQAAVVEAIGDRMDAPARKRLDRWTSERRAIEDELLRGDDGWQFRMDRAEALKQLDAQAMAELSESTRTLALIEDNFARTAALRAMRETRISLQDIGDDDEAFSGMQRRMSARMEALNESGDGTAPDAGQAAADPGMTALLPRGLQQPQVDRIREALGITAEQRATWDALAGDVLEASAKLHDEQAIKPSNMSGAPQEAMDALLRMSGYRAEQQALDEHWFESIGAAFPGLSRDALADQRSRRALQRLRDLGGIARMASMMSGDRSSDTDLDAAIDRLPKDIRARIAPQVMASRERRTHDLQASIDAAESLVRTMSEIGKRMKAAGMKLDEQPNAEDLQALMDAQQTFGAGALERAKRAKAADQEEVEAMSAILSPQGAATLRRAIRAQQYPEVYRAMDRIDRAIDRVMSLPDLSPAQLTTLSADADEFRARSDEIAERAIAGLVQAEAAQAEMMSTHVNPTDIDSTTLAAITERIRRSELANADLDYDRSELSARALRRMRAVLSSAQAQAAGLAER